MNLGEDDLKGLEHLFHLGNSGRVIKVILNSGLSDSRVLFLKFFNLVDLDLNFSGVDLNSFSKTLSLKFRIFNFIDCKRNSLSIAFKIIFALGFNLGMFIVCIDFLSLKIGSKIIEELTDSTQTVTTFKLECNGLKDFSSKRVIRDFFKLSIGGFIKEGLFVVLFLENDLLILFIIITLLSHSRNSQCAY